MLSGNLFPESIFAIFHPPYIDDIIPTQLHQRLYHR